MTRPTAERSTLSSLPLFADDESLGKAILGTARACEWKKLAPLFEREGLPKIDPIMRGRYVPAVRAFFDNQYLAGTTVLAPDGEEHPEAWAPRRKRRD